MIALMALEPELTVVTRNVRDFAATPVVLVNPWDQPGSKFNGKSELFTASILVLKC